MCVVVQQDFENRFYLHEVIGSDGKFIIIDKASRQLKTGSVKNGLTSSPNALSDITLTDGKEDVKQKMSFDDENYMLAVEAGDMDAAQEMVDEAAKAAGYVVRAYHGTESGGFNEFTQADDGYSFFFPVLQDLSGGRRDQAEHRFSEGVHTAVAQTADAEDLALMQRERRIFYLTCSHAAHFQHDLIADILAGILTIIMPRKLSADHELANPLCGEVLFLQIRCQHTIAQDRERITHSHNLVNIMRNKQHSAAAVANLEHR